MIVLRVIDKETNLFLRDDFDFDEETEIGLDVTPAQGLHKPKWSGDVSEDEEGNITVNEGEWVEGATQEEIDELTKPQPHEPTELELLMLAISELDVQREIDRTDNQVAIAELAELMIGGF